MKRLLFLSVLMVLLIGAIVTVGMVMKVAISNAPKDLEFDTSNMPDDFWLCPKSETPEAIDCINNYLKKIKAYGCYVPDDVGKISCKMLRFNNDLTWSCHFHSPNCVSNTPNIICPNDYEQVGSGSNTCRKVGTHYP